MKILIPHSRLSRPVRSYAEIKADSKEMIEMLSRGGFSGIHKEAHALAHSQVSTEPFSFFVLHPSIVKHFGGHQIICNAHILSKNEPLVFQEGCMSYPHRNVKQVRRYAVIVVSCDVIGIFGGMKNIVMELDGLEAFIMQHEIDHANAIDIYHK